MFMRKAFLCSEKRAVSNPKCGIFHLIPSDTLAVRGHNRALTKVKRFNHGVGKMACGGTPSIPQSLGDGAGKRSHFWLRDIACMDKVVATHVPLVVAYLCRWHDQQRFTVSGRFSRCKNTPRKVPLRPLCSARQEGY